MDFHRASKAEEQEEEEEEEEEGPAVEAEFVRTCSYLDVRLITSKDSHRGFFY
jgi:hypothetical protein